MPQSIDDFLGGYKAPQVVVSITQRADLIAEHTALNEELRRAIRDDLSGGGTAAAEARERIAEIEAEISASALPITLQALGRQEYQTLIAQHPPTPDDRKEGRGFNPETFPQALIAACAVEPAMTADQAERLCGVLSDGQFSKLWNAALVVNIGDDAAPKSVLRSATADRSATSSTTASRKASRGRSSSDGS